MILINIACVLALIVILWPLFMIAKYDYPSADDWSFGKNMYRAMQAGEGLRGVFHAIYQTLSQNAWEARFSILILSALQPAAFGEHFYRITPYLMIGSVVFSQLLFLGECIKDPKKENRWLLLPIGIPVAMLQVLYCPCPEESFYWYNGSVNYTFVYSLSLILLTLYLEIGIREIGRAKRILFTVLACLLAILIGGNNFATSVSTMCLLLCLQIVFLICRKDAFRRTWLITLLEPLGVIKCVTSPLTATRLNGNFGGSVANTPIMAILLSFERTFLNIISWTNLKTLLVLLLILPFLWKAVRKMQYTFRLPGLFTALSFGVYASQATATIYVDNTMGGGRQGAILWYFYVLWMVANVMYWCGWIAKRDTIKAQPEDKPDQTDKRGKIDRLAQKYLLRYCAVAGILLAAAVLFGNVQSTTSYRAYRMWRNGWAQAYGAGWEERLKVLKDDSVKNPVFTPLNYVELLMYTDLQPEGGYTWVNGACAEYYGKESVTVVAPGQSQ
ncbi:MAG TPA: hypothetical protein DGH14_11415 [Roseburia sp.]|nr:hypothetical protein [Roseburia sp.]